MSDNIEYLGIDKEDPCEEAGKERKRKNTEVSAKSKHHPKAQVLCSVKLQARNDEFIKLGLVLVGVLGMRS